MRIFDNRQAVFSAYTVGYLTEFSLLCFGIVVFLSVKKGNRIKAEMVVQMVFVKVGGDDYLILIAPHFFCGLQPDLVRLFGRNLVGLETLIAVPGDISVFLAVLLFR